MLEVLSGRLDYLDLRSRRDRNGHEAGTEADQHRSYAHLAAPIESDARDIRSLSPERGRIPHKSDQGSTLWNRR